jgi:4-hydroxybenzoate polyprenyltransferase
LHASPATAREIQVPLAVDLDGTLIRSDMLWESVVRLVRQNPLAALAIPFWWMKGRAHLKQQLAACVRVDPASLPYNEEFLDWLKEQKRGGRKLILATASDIAMAKPVADYLGLFDEVMASDGKTNLRHAAKLRALTAKCGERGFDYAGNSSVDLGVWAGTREAIVVYGTDSLARRAAQLTKVGKVFPSKPAVFAALLKSLRPHQWIKNLIVFLPVITSHRLTFWPLLSASGAFVAFCLCASGVYLWNDLMDLDADRRHPGKRQRPLASGALPLSAGLVAAPVLLLLSGIVAWQVTTDLVWLLTLYLVATTAYSWYFKRVALLDVFILAGLYTSRLIAGHLATGIEYSAWLLMFSMFIFLSLALMKRFQELQSVRAQNGQAVQGRGYTAGDLVLVTTLGLVSGFIAVLVLALYVNSEQVVKLYAHPTLLLLVCPLLLYWISRVWFLAHRGQMHNDPVAFAFKDWVSYFIGALTLVVMWLATGH